MREHVYGDETSEQRVSQKYADERMQAHVDKTFAYVSPQGDQPQRYAAITRATRELAQLYIDLAPPSAELTLALRDLESARMRVNQAIAVNEAQQQEPGTSGKLHTV